MKKFILFLMYLSLVLSCSENETSDDTEALRNSEPSVALDVSIIESPIKNLIIENKVYSLESILSNSNNTAADLQVKSHEKNFIETVYSDSLILYYDGTENARMFNGKKKFNEFFNVSFLRKEKTEQNLSASSGPIIGYSYCWDKSNYSGTLLSYREDINPGSQFIAITPFPSGGTWNDRISSIKVNNGAMEFHTHYSPTVYAPGYTLVVHDPNNDPTQAVGISNLANVNMVPYVSWNDQISQSRWLLTQP